MSSQVKFTYTGVALPGNAAVVTFVDTTNTGFGGNWADTQRMARVLVRLVNDQSGTLTLEVSPDRGTTWKTISTNAVAASAANSENAYDFLIEGLADFRIKWTNGTTPQTSWVPSVVATSQRHIAN
jgi:hypothetical protein